MGRLSFQRISAILFFIVLLIGAAFCLIRLRQDVTLGKYFVQPEERRYEIVFLSAYILIIMLLLRYGYYLAINRVSWATVKDDLLFLLNQRHFTKTQWILNLLLFWLALIGFIYSLAISVMKGNL